MTSHEVRVGHLLGRRVTDAEGRRVGRIEEIRACREDDEAFVAEYMVGEYALLERLSLGALSRSLLRKVPWLYTGYQIPWERMDLSDPVHPRLTCRRDELRKM
jgi:hypothetical protein